MLGIRGTHLAPNEDKEHKPLFALWECACIDPRERPCANEEVSNESLRRKERWHVVRSMRVPVPPWFPHCVNTPRSRDNCDIVNLMTSGFFNDRCPISYFHYLAPHANVWRPTRIKYAYVIFYKNLEANSATCPSVSIRNEKGFESIIINE